MIIDNYLTVRIVKPASCLWIMGRSSLEVNVLTSIIWHVSSDWTITEDLCVHIVDSKSEPDIEVLHYKFDSLYLLLLTQFFNLSNILLILSFLFLFIWLWLLNTVLLLIVVFMLLWYLIFSIEVGWYLMSPLFSSCFNFLLFFILWSFDKLSIRNLFY